MVLVLVVVRLSKYWEILANKTINRVHNLVLQIGVWIRATPGKYDQLAQQQNCSTGICTTVSCVAMVTVYNQL